MKFLLSAISAAALLAVVPCHGDDLTMVPGPHGGYNVIQGGGTAHPLKPAYGMFGPHSYTKYEAKYEEEHPEAKKFFLVRSVLVSDGHGNTHTVPRKIYYKSQEDLDAAMAASR